MRRRSWQGLFSLLVGALSRVLGFVRDLVLAYQFGASGVADSVIVAQSLPTMLSSVGNVLATTAVLPVVHTEAQKGIGAERDIWWSITLPVAAGTGLLATLAFAVARPLMSLLAPGFQQAQLNLVIGLFRITVWAALLMSVSAMLSCWMQLRGRFILPAAISVPVNVCMITAILLSPWVGLWLVGVGLVVGAAAQLVMLSRTDELLPFHWLGFGPALRVLQLALPAALGVASSQAGLFVERGLASALPPGSITILTLCYRFVLVGYLTLTASLGAMAFARANRSRTGRARSAALVEGLRGLGFLALPVTALVFVGAGPLLRPILHHGAFSGPAVAVAGSVLAALAPCFALFSIGDLYARACFVTGEPWRAAVGGVAGPVANIVASLALIHPLGIEGLAIGTTIGALVSTGCNAGQAVGSGALGRDEARALLREYGLWTACGVGAVLLAELARPAFGVIGGLCVDLAAMSVGLYLIERSQATAGWSSLKGLLAGASEGMESE